MKGITLHQRLLNIKKHFENNRISQKNPNNSIKEPLTTQKIAVLKYLLLFKLNSKESSL